MKRFLKRNSIKCLENKKILKYFNRIECAFSYSFMKCKQFRYLAKKGYSNNLYPRTEYINVVFISSFELNRMYRIDISFFYNYHTIQVTRNVIETVDNVVSQSEQNRVELNSKASSTILKSLETQLKTEMGTGRNFSKTQQNMVVDVVQIEDLNSPVHFEYFHDGNYSKTMVNQNPSYIENENLQVRVEIPSVILNSTDCKTRSE